MTQPNLANTPFDSAEEAEILPGMIFRLLNETDWPKMNSLITSDYSNQHPLSQVFDLSKEEIGDKDLKAAKAKLMNHSCLGTFIKTTGELIAVAMKEEHDIAVRDTIYTARQRKASVMRFWRSLIGDVFADLNTSRYTFLSMACVKEEYRSRGIITAMLDFEMHHARSKGCEYFVAIATSVFTQKALKRLGFKVLREVKYADYVDPETGLKPDLKLSPIHTSCQLMYIPIEL